jgi:hypothetical protein
MRPTRSIFVFSIGAAFAANFVTTASAAQLPDGVYRCQMYAGNMMMHLGDIEILGTTYRGPAFDGAYEGSYEYELTDAGTINWGGPMGGFDSGGNTIVSSVLKRDGDRAAFDVTMQLESGNFSTVSCSPE